jgi:quinol monooxygenase YgiN
MVSFIVRLRFLSEDHDELVQIVKELTRATRQEPGCVSYVPHWIESEPSTLLIYEQYKDEAGVEHHRGSSHFAKYAIGGLYQKMLDRTVENLQAIA